MKEKPYKVSATWWVGWVVTCPVRLIFFIFAAFFLAAMPSLFYGLDAAEVETDQSKWRP